MTINLPVFICKNPDFHDTPGPLGSRAAKAIGFIEKMIDYSYANAPLQKELLAGDLKYASVFVDLSSPYNPDASFYSILISIGLTSSQNLMQMRSEM